METGKVKEFFLILGGEKKYLSLVHEANISHSLRLEHTEWIFLVRGILFQDGQVLWFILIQEIAEPANKKIQET